MERFVRWNKRILLKHNVALRILAALGLRSLMLLHYGLRIRAELKLFEMLVGLEAELRG